MKNLNFKSLILSLMTILFLGSGVYGQKNISTPSYKKSLAKTVMVSAVELASLEYEKGTSLKEFLNNTGVQSKEEIAFISKVHSYLEKDKGPNEILAEDSGVESLNLINFKRSGNDVFKNVRDTSKRRWLRWLRLISDIIDIIADTIEEIGDAIQENLQ